MVRFWRSSGKKIPNEHRRKDAIWNVIAEGDFYQATK